MIYKVKEIQQLVQLLRTAREVYNVDITSEDFPYTLEVGRLRNLSRSCVILGILLKEFSVRLARDAELKEADFDLKGQFDPSDLSLWIHPIAQRSLVSLMKEITLHISTDFQV